MSKEYKNVVKIKCEQCGATDTVFKGEWHKCRELQNKFEDHNIICDCCEAINSFKVISEETHIAALSTKGKEVEGNG